MSCSIWFSAPSFWMGGGLESRCVGRVYGADGAVHGTICTVHTYVPETCGAKNISIKLPSFIKLAFHIISCVHESASAHFKLHTLQVFFVLCKQI